MVPPGTSVPAYITTVKLLLTVSTLFLLMCLTVSFIIGVLVSNNTIREKQIIEMMNQRITEVANGEHQEP